MLEAGDEHVGQHGHDVDVLIGGGDLVKDREVSPRQSAHIGAQL